MNATAPRRSQPFAMLILGLVLIGGIEMSNTLRQSIGVGMGDAFDSGLLVFSLFGFLALLAGIVTLRGTVRRVLLATLYVLMATLGAVMFLSWLAFWITGGPVNADAMGILLESPSAAILHLLSSDPLLLLAILVGLVAFLYGISWFLRFSLNATPEVPVRTRILLCLLFGFLTAFSAREIAATANSRSSYAALLGSPVADQQQARTSYICPRSPVVPIAPLAQESGAKTNGAPVIVLMIESLRADLMTTYSKAMPHLAELAKESLVFDKAYATASHSDFEDLSFWYSRYPLRALPRLGYPPDAPWRGISVFEYYKAHGYSTAYFSSQNEKWGNMINWLQIPAIDTYFDSENFTGETWENHDDDFGLVALIRAGRARSGKVEDSRTLGLAADWIDKHASEPFFLGMNLQNTHYNYFIPEGGAHPYQPDELGFRAIYSAWPREKAPIVRNRYLNAAYNVDAALAQFVERLKKAGVWDKAVVLVIGDGGEAFYEHGFGNHSGPMYDEVATTLAMLKLPKGDARNGTHWPHPVSHIDFVPMLAEVSGGPEWPGFQGTTPWMRPVDAPIYLAADAIVREDSVVRWPWKLMQRTFPRGSLELYNLETDPKETQSVVATNQPLALQMQKDLRSFRMCQFGYYADAKAHTRLQPPRYFAPGAQSSTVAASH